MYSLQASFSYVFFGFSFFFSAFCFMVFMLRLRPWCSCEVCRSYLTSAWSRDFDNLCDWYTHLLRKSPTRTIHVHILGNTITANPDNVEYILKTRFDNYPKGKPFSTILGDLLGHGIFNVDGEPWRFQRKMASLELGSLSVRSYAFGIVSSEVETRMLPLLASVAVDGGVVDLQDLFRRFSFDNICKISFGLDPGCLELSLPMSEFALAFDLASQLSAKRATLASPLIWKTKRLLNIGSERRLRNALKLVNELAAEVIRQRMNMGTTGQHDLLSRFMGTVNDEEYLRDIVISFLLAGRDTVAASLTSFFWLLAKHPDVEAAVREEIEKVLSGEAAVASFDQLKEMHYLHAAMYESMRLFPPVQFDSKFAQEDDVLPDGTFIRTGRRVTYHPFAMGRMEDIWGKDCLQFRPERWFQDGKFKPESPYKYPVFQGGLRVCLGKEMALLEIKSVAVAMVRRFKIEVVNPGIAPKFAPGLTATLNGGLSVRVHDMLSGH
ncbi:cytochrome P450 94C1-like [Aristolochia californica]|uniref:cytochrome P450 94C1-like n=1 Tax=Aristolochia californica TaxID=171875 RepID=UPI0035DAD5F8